MENRDFLPALCSLNNPEQCPRNPQTLSGPAFHRTEMDDPWQTYIAKKYIEQVIALISQQNITW
jgi:hypothetical protein